MKNLGGYVIIDCSNVKVTVSGASVVVTDPIMARQLRTNKPKYLYNAQVTQSGVVTSRSGYVTGESSTGAYNGQTHTGYLGANKVTITTDDDNVTFALA